MAYDIDPQAATASRSNAEANGVADRLATTVVRDEIGQGYDIVLANILAGPLYELAEDIADRLSPNGTLVLSGILETQCDALNDRYSPWITFDLPSIRDGWACLVGTRR